ncbi:MAG: ATP-grasp domain-containing protein, partial [Faecalibacterium sp.]
VLGIGDQPYDELKPELKDSLNEYYKVGSLENYDEVYRAVAFFIFKYGRIDWLESNNEYWLERDAALRTDFHITSGFQTEDMPRIKYKSKMKEYYRKAGIATARYHMVDDLNGCKAFIKQVGYPVVVKPDNGVGASDTHKLSNDEELKTFLACKAKNHPDVSYIMEEFVRAEVNSYDAIIDASGNPIFEAGNVSPMSIMDIVNDNDNSIYYIIKDLPEDTRAAGRAAVKSFGVKSRFIHFEFFRMTENQASMGKKGQIVALEVNMRPCGGFTPDMINFARSTNVYKIWADMIAFGGTDMPVGEHFYCPFAGRRDGKHFVYSHEQIMQKYQQNIRMVDRIPDALSGAMGNQMYVATFSTREGMEQFYSDVLAVTDDNNAAVQKELSSILALGEPEATPAQKPAAPAAKKARTTKKK